MGFEPDKISEADPLNPSTNKNVNRFHPDFKNWEV
jgi:hypothetical protein